MEKGEIYCHVTQLFFRQINLEQGSFSKTVSSLTEFLLQNRDIKFRNFDSLSVAWKNEKFTLTEKIFRQINYLVISLNSKYVGFTKFLPKKSESFP